LDGGQSAIVDEQLSPSLLCADIIQNPNSPMVPDDASNGFQVDASEIWETADILFNDDVFAFLNQPASGTNSEVTTSTALSPVPWLDGPGTFRQSLALPGRIYGGPEATEALMKSWFDQVCPAWSAFDSCLNPNRKIALELMHHSPPVFDTLQSMSASFLSARLPQLRRQALQLLRKAATTVMTEAETMRQNVVFDTVPTGLLFSLFCLGTSVCWLDAKRLGLPFLKEAKELLHRLSWQTFNVDEDQLERLAFFRKSLVYWEMLLSFADDYDPSGDSSQNNECNLLLAPACDAADSSTDMFLHPWTGISTRTSRLFARTIRLCRSYRRRVAKPSGSEITMSAAMDEMKEAQKIEEHLMSLEFSATAPISQTGDEKTPLLHLAYVAEAYQLASLLQLYLTFPDLVAMRLPLDSRQPTEPVTCDKWTIPLALRLIELLEQIPSESGSRVIQPLLYICASTGLCYNISSESAASSSLHTLDTSSLPATCATLNILGYIDQMDDVGGELADDTPVPEIAIQIGDARNFIMRRLDSLECSLQPRPIAVAKELVKAIWAAYDDPNRGCKLGHWLDVMEAQDLRSLFG
jgi:hypothetical protein